MKATRWLSKEAILAIHTELIAEHGGSHGVRDEGLLESALARPRNLVAYSDDVTLYALAASYSYGIVRNHPFVDGNKRTGLMAAYVFLHMNGSRLSATEMDAIVTFTELAAGNLTEAQLSAWLKKNSKRKR